jgi:hypothetical protein
VAASAAVPTIASAQPYYGRNDGYDYCRHQRQGNTVAGAVIGGIAGALIGHGIARHDDPSTGTAIGAALGGSVGAGIGHSSSRCDDRYDRSGYYDHRREPYSYDRREYYGRGYEYPGYYSRPYGGYYEYDRRGDYYGDDDDD